MDKKICELCEKRQYAAVKEMLSRTNVVDVADVLEELDEPTDMLVFRMLPKDKAADVFAYLSREMRERIIDAITDRELGGIIDDLFLDDAVDFVEEMPANVVRRVLANVRADTRDMINQFLKYPEDSAGSVMTVEYVSLKTFYTVSDAFTQIRRTALDKETVYTCYVVDESRKLLGAVSVRQLLLADERQLIGDIMERGVKSARTMEDREEILADFRKYDLMAMPVVDGDDRLVGIVTIDDVLVVMEEETSEDFALMGGLTPLEDSYLKTSVARLTQSRVVWLMILMLGATMTGSIITGFETALSALPALMAFIPMLMSTGGNAGSQSSTLIIRGMAVGEITGRDALRVLWKEARVSLLCGLALMAVNVGRMLLLGNSLRLTLTVSLALLTTVMIAKAFGSMLPMAAKALRLDPAVMASPVISTLVDACALMLYFTLAKVILGI